MTPRDYLVASVVAIAILASACGSSTTDNSSGAGTPGGEDQQSADTGSVAQVADDSSDVEEAYREYEAADRLPVADSEGAIVGYMNYTEYYSGDQDPVLIEVRSNDDDSLIGYRLRFVGFVPLDQLVGEGSIEQIVEELYGESQAEAQAYLDEVNAEINSMSEEELRDLADS